MPYPQFPSPYLDRLAVILVRARNPQNIGAVARAMHDFGFTDLRIVNDFPVPLEAARSAIDASAILAAATEFPSVAAAIADCTLVLGTTAVGERDLQHPLHTLAEAAPGIHTELAGASDTRVALLFGSEKTGLSNEELSHANALLTIPMQPYPDRRHPSMNLGQAVAVCLYELNRTEPSLSGAAPGAISEAVPGCQDLRELRRPRISASRPGLAPKPATGAEQERLTALFEEVLAASEYTRHHPANSETADIRRLLLRLNISQTDAPVLMGVLRQVLWKLRNSS